MKIDKKKFLNTYKPVLKYNPMETNLVSNRKDITDDWIEKKATLLSRDTKPTTEERRAIYTLGGVIYFDHIMQKHRTIT
jgi:hypothetical protein